LSPSKSDINKRFVLVFLKLEREEVIISRADAARKLDLVPQTLNEIVKGRMNVSAELVKKFFTVYKVNPFYILFEKLPIILDASTYLEFIEKSVHPFVHPFVHPINKIEEVTSPEKMVAEPEVIYRPSPGTIELFVKKYGDEGVDVASSIPIGELSRLLGIEEVKELLTRLLAQLPAKK
jgi:DNA-binding XRE family transcriptional regulator